MVRRTKEEAQETRNRILDAAERVFYEKGVSRTTLADIAHAAGVTRGAIYWHFANKGDLFNAMFDRSLLPLDELVEATLDGKEPDPLARIREIFIWCMRSITADEQRRRVFDILFLKCEFVEEMGPVRERHQNNMRDGMERIERALRNAIEKKQLPAALDTRRATTLLHGLFTGILHDSLMLPGSVDPEHDSEAVIDACFDALRCSPALLKNAGYPERSMPASLQANVLCEEHKESDTN
ncbi:MULTISPECIES: TetR family transcriptional regulator [unclassified Caballeronia]|uniref:TetR family transcriptional regulator n=1 Tax=unclassified Caballeronia TaxID=2646786 RepID=UPI002028FC2C|nr:MULTISPECIES: TetR family transcriptional regulator [unclassified Caballeronia]MDR5770645.1 TetR family transcriptional regulator [Caballeronia sp. LZ002]MDR5802956.1 TetR family transcriptional regulator [Caballeronia sp. LZ001]MDR5846082.1 TetR family transcriptional regulator [Caballeronia sp. LZ003]